MIPILLIMWTAFQSFILQDNNNNNNNNNKNNKNNNNEDLLDNVSGVTSIDHIRILSIGLELACNGG